MDAKYILAVAVLVAVLSGVADSFLLTADGGTQGFIIPDKPFYVGDGGCLYPPSINITYPLNGSNFFFPSVTPNVTFTLSGATNPVCYTATSGNFTVRECVNGVNWYLETLPPGDGVPLSILVIDDCGSNVSETILLNVNYNHGTTAVLDDDFIIWLFVLVAFSCICYSLLTTNRS